MKREQIIEMANSAGLYSGANEIAWAHALERFAAIVAAAEREECAKECEREVMYPGGMQESAAHENVWSAAKAIRARGQK